MELAANFLKREPVSVIESFKKEMDQLKVELREKSAQLDVILFRHPDMHPRRDFFAMQSELFEVKKALEQKSAEL